MQTVQRAVSLMVILWTVATSVHAADVKVAVTSSFLDAMTVVAEEFQKATGHRVLMNEGSSGELYAEIINEVPFDVYVADNELDPRSLEEERFAVRGSRIAYAVGHLTLWSRDSDRVGSDGAQLLRSRQFRHLAIANPRTSTYGQASIQAMKALGVWPLLEERVVEARSSREAFQLVASGKAELGLVPLAEVLDSDVKSKGSRWDVPASFYTPIRQEAVLLLKGEANPAAGALMEFLRSPKAREIMQRFGFGLP
jgi:molybdate transport system substrate-binding protein